MREPAPQPGIGMALDDHRGLRGHGFAERPAQRDPHACLDLLGGNDPFEPLGDAFDRRPPDIGTRPAERGGPLAEPPQPSVVRGVYEML